MIRWAAGLVWAIGLAVAVIWVAPADEDSFDIGLGSHPAVAMDPGRHVVVVWESSDNEVLAQELTDVGERVGDALRVESTDAEQHNPVVTHLASSEFVVAWQEQVGDGSHIIGRRLRLEDEPVGILVSKRGIFLGSMFRVTDSGSSPAVGSDDQGNFTVAWTAPALPSKAQPKGDHLHYARRFDVNNAPLGDAIALGKRGFATPPALAVRDDGSSLVVWEDVARDVRGSVIDDSGTLLNDGIRINASRAGRQTAPAATVAADGHFTVVWERHLPDGSRWLFGRRVTAGGELIGDEFQISLSPTDVALEPAVAADPWGRTLVTWRSSPLDSEASEILGRALGLGEGSANGLEMSIAPPDARNARIHVSTSAADDFMVVWQGGSESLSTSGTIFGRFLRVDP